MIFKFSDRWHGVGRRIDAVSRGHFVVIAPIGWRRRGLAPVAPAETADPAFEAHYFFRDGDPPPDGIGFEECDLALTPAGFSLTGKCLYDDSTEGELFIGSPPELSPGRGVTWARVGEEKDGWLARREFSACEERSLAAVLDHRQGRFFVRVYDGGTKLCDSGEFRFVESLRGILVDGEPYNTGNSADAHGRRPHLRSRCSSSGRRGRCHSAFAETRLCTIDGWKMKRL